MTDYAIAFHQGIEAAEAAKNAKVEVAAVFAELNRQMLGATDGKLSIQLKHIEINEFGALPMKGMLGLRGYKFGMIGAAAPDRKKEFYTAIVASNPTNPSAREIELAKWVQDRAGYPCKISFFGNSISCDDRESLETAIGELLRDPFIGSELQKVINGTTNALEV